MHANCETSLTGLEVGLHVCDHSNNKPICELAISREKCKFVDMGHRFGNVSVLATIPGHFHLKKLEWTSNANRLKFNGWLVHSNISFIGPAIVAFVRS